MKVYHGVEPATIFINGKKVKELPRRGKRHYQDIDISEHAGVLMPGRNVLAVHCSAGKRVLGFDIGLYSVGD